VIGAAALAVHGVTRSTRDLDLFSLAPECLERATWEPLERGGIAVQTRPADPDDPLAGVVRLSAAGEYPVDLIVGRSRWQEGITGRARPATIGGVELPVAARPDLVLLKLYAGGLQDAWDVEQLLAGPDRRAVEAEVEASVSALPADSQRLWRRLRGSA
jgi:hypothetical protein